MITNDQQLDQAIEQLGRMYRALAALKRDVLPVNAKQFALMAEGPMDEIRKLLASIDAYTAVADVPSVKVPAVKGRRAAATRRTAGQRGG